MSDIFDYLFFYLLTIMLAAFKITGFIDWSWWIIGAPSIFALFIHIAVLMMGEK